MRNEKGQFMKGLIPWNKGKLHSRKTKEKIRIKAINRFKNPKNHPWFGREHSEESKEKLRLSHLGKYNGEKNPFYGKKHKKELKEKWADGRRGGKNNPSYGKRGAETSRWTGGATRPDELLKNHFEFKEWRKFIFKKDDYTCQRCLLRSGFGKAVTLHAHHIIPYAVAREERLEKNNGATLCKDCHKWIHMNEISAW